MTSLNTPIIHHFRFIPIHYTEETEILYAKFHSLKPNPDVTWLRIAAHIRIDNKYLNTDTEWRILSICYSPSKTNVVRGEILLAKNRL